MLLTRIIGDMPIDRITRKDAHLFREAALKLPQRLHQLPDQPLEQSIAEATSTISVTTFNNYVKNLTTFFYAAREGYCSRNPFDGLCVRIRRKGFAVVRAGVVDVSGVRGHGLMSYRWCGGYQGRPNGCRHCWCRFVRERTLAATMLLRERLKGNRGSWQ